MVDEKARAQKKGRKRPLSHTAAGSSDTTKGSVIVVDLVGMPPTANGSACVCMCLTPSGRVNRKQRRLNAPLFRWYFESAPLWRRLWSRCDGLLEGWAACPANYSRNAEELRSLLEQK